MNLVTHQGTQALVYELMALQGPFALKRVRHDDGFKMRVVGALNADDGIRQAGFDQRGNLGWIHVCLFANS